MRSVSLILWWRGWSSNVTYTWLVEPHQRGGWTVQPLSHARSTRPREVCFHAILENAASGSRLFVYFSDSSQVWFPKENNEHMLTQTRNLRENNYVTAKRTVKNIMLKTSKRELTYSRGTCLQKKTRITNFFVSEMSASLPKKLFDLWSMGIRINMNCSTISWLSVFSGKFRCYFNSNDTIYKNSKFLIASQCNFLSVNFAIITMLCFNMKPNDDIFYLSLSQKLSYQYYFF